LYPGCSSYRSENKSFVHTFNILIKSAFIYRKEFSPPLTAPPHTHTPNFCFVILQMKLSSSLRCFARCSCRIFLEAFRKIGDHVKYDHSVFDQMMSTVCFSLRLVATLMIYVYGQILVIYHSLFRFQVGYPIFL